MFHFSWKLITKSVFFSRRASSHCQTSLTQKNKSKKVKIRTQICQKSGFKKMCVSYVFNICVLVCNMCIHKLCACVVYLKTRVKNLTCVCVVYVLCMCARFISGFHQLFSDPFFAQLHNKPQIRLIVASQVAAWKLERSDSLTTEIL